MGAGIVGLNCALALRKREPKAKIVVLERGLLPKGASTKNAGFACFGSASELLSDMNQHTEDEMRSLVEMRYKGIQLLRQNLGDKNIGYKNYGGYELFIKGDPEFFEACLENRKRLNKILKPVFGKKVFEVKENKFGFRRIQDHMLYSAYEGQIDTGMMMSQLHRKCISESIHILYGVTLHTFEELNNQVHLETDLGGFQSGKLFVATNGFARNLLDDEIKPARAQVLITSVIPKLKFKGTFHIDQGYYYFRNINGRVLFGGGRNLDIGGEQTEEFGETPLIQNKLETLLREVILPETDFTIDHRWSGIMGVGESKLPILRQLSENVYCGVRLSGMGIALGSHTGRKLARLSE
ncbi:NAD(P)/FAD-dependent oxidoreductase [Robertkochia solimangrovi]|uniref:NAD(P)/FAD-dependent oxidoreductase n=1 Tax=Robertkochia solimangrovi TaxID=2213046 RepID=UPI00117E7611|nr:FAD-dependent oxidoreductase [Robertkochia solimangrovi]TRZ46127.1 FAD-dependent oxidoreductase [Robertkochia solimangrovi]